MVYYSALHYAAKAKKSEEKAAEYLQQVSNKITAVEGNIGDIGFAPLGIDETQNKRRYLNGQVISQAQFKSFTNKIKAAIELTPNLVTSETNWQAEVTNSVLGQCGKFVIDDALGTIRLPKVVNINGLQDLALMGSIKVESLPNITGYIQDQNQYAGPTTAAGAFARESLSSSSWIGTNNQSGNYTRYTFDASRVSEAYQDNAPVQQEAIQYPYFIQVATGTEESVDVTREIELNNPFSLLDYKWSEYELSNASWLLSNGAFHSGATYVAVYELLLKIHNGTETKDGVSVKLSTEVYEDTDFVINTADKTFRLPIKVKLASGNAVVGNGRAIALFDGTYDRYMTSRDMDAADYVYAGSTMPTDDPKYAGDTYSGWANANNGKLVGLSTDPTKSGIETSSSGLKLYFYVGETIQDANVINASGVLTRVADLSDSYISAQAMPSGKYIDLTLGASGTTYTAPANGWFYLSKTTSSTNQYIHFGNETKDYTLNQFLPTNSNNCRLIFPVQKGDIVKVTYTAGGTTNNFRFIYAEGEN